MDPKDSTSPASYKLLAAEEGHISVHSGPMEGIQDPLVGNLLGACPQSNLPLPCHHYEMSMDREVYPHDNPTQLGMHEPVLELAYHDDGRFNYKGVPYHLGINPDWMTLQAEAQMGSMAATTHCTSFCLHSPHGLT